MAGTFSQWFEPRDSGNWIRLRTLVALRWWAIAGQISALIIAQRLYNLKLEIGLCFVVVGALIISNLIATIVYPANKRLSERETLMVVMFDMCQLGLMLYLTGGLHNPFSILIVGPVTVSASALSTRSTIFLGTAAIAITTALTEFHMPLRTQEGFILRMPDLFLYGNWTAIVIAVVFLGVYSRWIVTEMREMSQALQATQMALARGQKLSDLGGVVAAAAHELGTPLATIKLASAELAEELEAQPELRDDALLIRQEANRCRDILQSMGRVGKDDLHLRSAPLAAVVEEAAEPHIDRGKTILYEHSSEEGHLPQPTISRRPEIVHGLRNLIQNAVDFAADTVWIETGWTRSRIIVRIMDNGRGYAPAYLGRIGEPLKRPRRARDPERPEYEGMGLGLFIAKTLLEQTGADLSFANGGDAFVPPDHRAERSGAFVEITWPRDRVVPDTANERVALGQNQPIPG